MTPDRLRTPEVDALIEALLSLDDPDDMYALLQDLCTVREIQDMPGFRIDRTEVRVSEYQRCIDAGAESVSEPVQLEEWPVTAAFVKDPDGYLVEIQAFLDPSWPRPAEVQRREAALRDPPVLSRVSLRHRAVLPGRQP